MSIVTKSIVNADAEARYLSPGELDRIKSFVTSGERRLRIAQALTENRERIVKQAGDQLFQKRPDVVSPGGNAYGEEMTATCLRDLDYYLRLITYGVVSGDVTPIEEIVNIVNSSSEVSKRGLPPFNRSIDFLKQNFRGVFRFFQQIGNRKMCDGRHGPCQLGPAIPTFTRFQHVRDPLHVRP